MRGDDLPVVDVVQQPGLRQFLPAVKVRLYMELPLGGFRGPGREVLDGPLVLLRVHHVMHFLFVCFLLYSVRAGCSTSSFSMRIFSFFFALARLSFCSFPIFLTFYVLLYLVATFIPCGPRACEFRLRRERKRIFIGEKCTVCHYTAIFSASALIFPVRNRTVSSWFSLFFSETKHTMPKSATGLFLS